MVYVHAYLTTVETLMSHAVRNAQEVKSVQETKRVSGINAVTHVLEFVDKIRSVM
jgi:hypothetical protein